MLLKAVVVDDEPLAREELCYMLEQLGSVEAWHRPAMAWAVGIVERFTPAYSLMCRCPG